MRKRFPPNYRMAIFRVCPCSSKTSSAKQRATPTMRGYAFCVTWGGVHRTIHIWLRNFDPLALYFWVKPTYQSWLRAQLRTRQDLARPAIRLIQHAQLVGQAAVQPPRSLLGWLQSHMVTTARAPFGYRPVVAALLVSSHPVDASHLDLRAVGDSLAMSASMC